MSKIEVDAIEPQSGTSLTLGASGDTITIPSGATLSSTDPLVFPAGTVSLPAITTTGDTNTGIFFPAADTIAFTEGGGEAMRITSAGAMLLGTTTAGSASAGDLVVNGGVFLGGTATANELDDYEEGTWTPTVAPFTSGTVTLHPDTNGIYTKIGDLVYCEAYIRVSSKSSPTGYFSILGLPFTSSSGAFRAGSIVFFNSLNANVSNFMIYNNASSNLIICVLGDGTNQQLDSANQITATTQMRISISYKV
jgi:hypothetical protein